MKRFDKLSIWNPKRYVTRSRVNAGWIDYYAGFCPGFAKALLETSGLARGAVVLDPWNGSGTTTEAASVLGFSGHGFDVNPVMLIVGKARMLRHPTTPSIRPLMLEIVKSAKTRAIQTLGDDPLSLWFNPAGVSAVRKLEAGLQHLLVKENSYRRVRDIEIDKEISDLAAFFYNALFRTVRRTTGNFRGSNPTWIRVSTDDEEKVAVRLTSLCHEFKRQVTGMLTALNEVSFCHLNPDYHLAIASSTDMPVEGKSVDMILSSPPYCTRIDYAITTLPELAVMGYSKDDVRSLREQMIGTSTIARDQPVVEENWGSACTTFLRKVAKHPSKASATYYYKNHVQYFDGMAQSLKECHRVLKKGGRCILVVQDSYYKDLHNDLPKIVSQMARASGLQLESRRDFKQARTMAAVNPRVRFYRNNFSATESVMVFSRDG